ncbi:TetR/AcrR family transcriptional regulator [Kutzneria sp. CA-103260]|uniref:TetR/AcrR family transcriptional regulator n=1 Tax=Kutzneria sp. CA-103260 TaxID=2802641 RepID=UPI001BA74585|nr:TetR/AcrR family transcriptional regulator [Kutzneria sp. CA-103260]QUQ63841.1 TetR/AcrR family transcriptional regulator [Kutzneria sp. CA-103260]
MSVETLPAKRQSVVRAAAQVFVREGYVGASVDVIATEAGVSKQTIYNYYRDKENLFLSVIDAMLQPVAERFLAVLDEILLDEADLAAGLVRLGRAWTALLAQEDLAALRRLIVGEATRYPQLLAAWQNAGPGQAQPKLTAHLTRLSGRGVLTVPDPERAANQLTSLLIGEVQTMSLFGAVDVPASRVDDIVTSGVQVFLRAYSAAD